MAVQLGELPRSLCRNEVIDETTLVSVQATLKVSSDLITHPFLGTLLVFLIFRVEIKKEKRELLLTNLSLCYPIRLP